MAFSSSDVVRVLFMPPKPLTTIRCGGLAVITTIGWRQSISAEMRCLRLLMIVCVILVESFIHSVAVRLSDPHSRLSTGIPKV